jgi:hypothetical protein
MNAWLLVTKFHALNISDLLDATLSEIVDALETIQMV